ncbi:hypothetical protein [Aureivirga sp. CE67]|uniref:hypothetical protein n=1 Tax=Aureivirga sp. CE67 TaxID=1788983 RepID=UPI0018CB43A8|nr:hypothetical protein [Aureivirga sp. CE67]
METQLLKDKNTLSVTKLSILMSSIGIITAIIIQYSLFKDYQLVSGKTRAFFWLKQLPYYNYIVFGALAFLLSIYILFKKEKLRLKLLSVGMSITAILILISNSWKWFS